MDGCQPTIGNACEPTAAEIMAITRVVCRQHVSRLKSRRRERDTEVTPTRQPDAPQEFLGVQVCGRGGSRTGSREDGCPGLARFGWLARSGLRAEKMACSVAVHRASHRSASIGVMVRISLPKNKNSWREFIAKLKIDHRLKRAR